MEGTQSVEALASKSKLQPELILCKLSSMLSPICITEDGNGTLVDGELCSACAHGRVN